MLTFKEEHVTYDRKNADHMLFEFIGKNEFDKEIYIEAKAACGCSGVNSDFKVQSGKEFKLTGFLKRRSKKGMYTKKVTVKAYDKGLIKKSLLKKKTLKFTINVQEPTIKSSTTK